MPSVSSRQRGKRLRSRVALGSNGATSNSHSSQNVHLARVPWGLSRGLVKVMVRVAAPRST